MTTAATKTKPANSANPDEKLPDVRPANLPAAAPAFMAEKVPADAGKGVSSDQSDNLVPLVYVLQPLSPQVDRRSSAYIEGAEPGDIWLRNASDPIVKGDEGFLFQPCGFYKEFVEWVPREEGGGSGSGFVARHAEVPPEAKPVEDERTKQVTYWEMPNGNEIIETRVHAGFALRPGMAAQPFMIALSGTGHSVSRAWMFKMNSKVVSGVVAPSFAHTYRLTTKQRKNAKGTWFVLDVADGDWVQTPEEYERGKMLNAAVASGTKRAEAPMAARTDVKDDIPF